MTNGPGREAGSPPHTRGAGGRDLGLPAGAGITPAYAGSSRGLQGAGAVDQDHPRIRGEQEVMLLIELIRQGSPPHTRGADVLP